MHITYAHILHAHTYKVHYHKAFPFQAILPIFIYFHPFSTWSMDIHGIHSVPPAEVSDPWGPSHWSRGWRSQRSAAVVNHQRLVDLSADLEGNNIRFESIRLTPYPYCSISCMKWKKHGECVSMTQKKQKIWTAQNSNCKLHSLLSLLHRNKLTQSPQLFHPVPFLGPTWKRGTSRKKNVTKKTRTDPTVHSKAQKYTKVISTQELWASPSPSVFLHNYRK